MFKKFLTIALLAIAVQVSAGYWCTKFQLTDDMADCEKCAQEQTVPDYYCDCQFGTPLYYGLDTLITDHAWFYAYARDMADNGINGYWFADQPLKLEFFLFCSQDTALMTRTLGANYNMAIEPEEFERYLSKAGGLANNMKVRIRASVQNPTGESASGRMIGLSTKQGLTSNCETEYFPVMRDCKTILNDEVENVYELTYNYMSSYYRIRNPFVIFKRKQELSSIHPDMELYVTADSCNGPVVAQTVLHDSIHAYFLDTLLMQQQYMKQKSLFLHCIPHPNTAATNISKGKLFFCSSYKTRFEQVQLDTTICYGAWLAVGDTMLTESTTYTDTVALAGDTVFRITQYNLTVVSPELIDTTLYWRQADLNNARFDGWKKFNEFGLQDTVYRYHENGGCTEAFLVNVVHMMDTAYVTKDSTVCQGKVITLQKNKYTSDTTVVVESTLNNYPDSLTIITWNLHFVAPELEYGTIYLNYQMLPYNYHGTSITNFGTHEVYIANANPNECDRRVQLSCLRTEGDIQYITETIDTTLCKGKILYLQDLTVTTSGTYEVLTPLDSVTILKSTYKVRFEALPTETDTVYTSSLPIIYESETVNKYGLTVLTLDNYDECTRKIKLYVIYQTPPTEYTYETIDTTLCVGQSIKLNGTLYTTDTTVVVEKTLAEYQILQTTYNLHFTQLETINDTIVLRQNELPTYYKGKYIASFGEYDIDTETEDGCLQRVHLLVEKTYGTELATITLSRLELHPTLTNTGEIIAFTAFADGVLLVTDMLGRVVLTEPVLTGEHYFSLPQQGNYIVKYQTYNSLQTGRVVVK